RYPVGDGAKRTRTGPTAVLEVSLMCRDRLGLPQFLLAESVPAQCSETWVDGPTSGVTQRQRRLRWTLRGSPRKCGQVVTSRALPLVCYLFGHQYRGTLAATKMHAP